ncbi:hypothetical protein TSUD_348210, partial [Trifolium subterraneum]
VSCRLLPPSLLPSSTILLLLLLYFSCCCCCYYYNSVSYPLFSFILFLPPIQILRFASAGNDSSGERPLNSCSIALANFTMTFIRVASAFAYFHYNGFTICCASCHKKQKEVFFLSTLRQGRSETALAAAHVLSWTLTHPEKKWLSRQENRIQSQNKENDGQMRNTIDF